MARETAVWLASGGVPPQPTFVVMYFPNEQQLGQARQLVFRLIASKALPSCHYNVMTSPATRDVLPALVLEVTLRVKEVVIEILKQRVGALLGLPVEWAPWSNILAKERLALLLK